MQEIWGMSHVNFQCEAILCLVMMHYVPKFPHAFLLVKGPSTYKYSAVAQAGSNLNRCVTLVIGETLTLAAN